MTPESILTVLKTQDPAFTLDHARAVAGYAEERGLTPFTEFYAMLQRGRLIFKDHYSSVGRWAQQQGGYRKSRKIEKRQNGDISCTVEIVANRDYAAALKAVTMCPQVDLREELQAYAHRVEVIVTAAEMSKRPAPTGRTWEWLAEKRATEAALLEVFGREPSQARQLYALTIDHGDAVAALYGDPTPTRAALPAPAPVTPVVEGVSEDDEAPDWDEATDAQAVQKLQQAADQEAAKPSALKTLLLPDGESPPLSLTDAHKEWSTYWNKMKRRGIGVGFLSNAWGVAQIVARVEVLKSIYATIKADEEAAKADGKQIEESYYADAQEAIKVEFAKLQ